MEFEAEMNRLSELDMAVRSYLSHLAAFEQGSEQDKWLAEFWREEIEVLTSGEPYEVES